MTSDFLFLIKKKRIYNLDFILFTAVRTFTVLKLKGKISLYSSFIKLFAQKAIHQEIKMGNRRNPGDYEELRLVSFFCFFLIIFYADLLE